MKLGYSTIQKKGDPGGGVTIGGLCTIAGLRGGEIKRCLYRFGDISSFIGEVVAGKEEWLERSFSGIAERKRIHDEKISLNDIRQELSLKPNTYNKYAAFIKRLKERLNRE